MKKCTLLVLFCLLLTGSSLSSPAAKSVLIRNATIVPGVGDPISNADLLIENGKISRIGPNLETPAGAEVIDASGKFLYPGLIAVMTAVGVTGYPGAGNDTDEVGISTPQMDPYDAINPEDDCIEVTRMEGVTTVQTVSGSRSVINGKSVVLDLSGDLAEEMVVKRYAAQIINIGAKERSKYPSTQPGVVAYLKAKFDAALEYAEKRNKEEKPVEAPDKSDGSPSKRDLELEALVPVVTGKVPAFFITHNEVTIRNALELIKEYKLKGVIQAQSGILKYADRIAHEEIPVIWAGTTVVPQRWEPHDLNYHTAAVLAEKGVLFAFSPGGWGLGNRNVRNLTEPAAISVAHGLSPQEAVQAITINPARILGIADETGTLEVGKKANVVIWTGSPLQGRSRVSGVFIRGESIPLTSFQTRLYEKYRKIVADRLEKQ